MRVEIKYSDKSTGMLSKTLHYVIDFQFFFSEEEKAVIRKADLSGIPFLNRSAPSDSEDYGNTDLDIKYLVTVGQLVKEGGFTHAAVSKRYAHDFVVLAKEALPKLKDLITQYADLSLEDETIEL